MDTSKATFEVEHLPRNYDVKEFLLCDNAETLLDEVARLKVSNTKAILNAVKALLDLSWHSVKKSKHTVIRIRTTDLPREFLIEVCDNAPSKTLAVYETKIRQIEFAEQSVYLVQDLNVKIGDSLHLCLNLEEKILETETPSISEFFEEVGKRHGLSGEEFKELYLKHENARRASEVRIEKGNKTEKKPCIIYLNGRESVFEYGTNGYDFLMVVLKHSRNLERGANRDLVSEELFDKWNSRRGNGALHRRELSHAMGHFNEKVQRDTGIPYPLIVKGRNKYTFRLNPKFSLSS